MMKQKPFFTKYLKLGSYSLALCAVALVAVIVLNGIVTALPTKYTQFDTTSSSLSEIGDASKAMAASIEDDVTFYLVATTGSEDSVLMSLLRRYTDAGSHLSIETVDPANHPTFLTGYGAESAGENSIVVVNRSEENRFKVIDNADMYQYYIDEFGEYFDYATAAEYYQMYAQFYGTELTVTQYFRGEQLLTSALDYVTSDSLPAVYVLTGHGETALADELVAMLEADNLVINTDYNLLLLEEDSLPADCHTVIINLPTNDLDEAEADLLISYIKNEGTVLLVTGYSEGGVSGMTNLMRVAAAMGLAPEDGYLADGDKNHYTVYNRRYYSILPDAGTDGPFNLLDSTGKTFLLLMAHGIKAVADYEGEAVLIPLLSTSEQGYVKKGTVSSVSKEEGDVEGLFYAGAAAVMPDDDGNGTTGSFVWYASPYIESDLYANRDLFVTTVNWMAGRASSISIDSKVVDNTYLDPFTEAEIGTWTTVAVFVLPACFLVGGFIVWIRRRRQ